MARGFLDELLSGIFGDTKRPDVQRPDLSIPMLAHWLPYRMSIGVQTGPPIGAQKGPPFTMAQG